MEFKTEYKMISSDLFIKRLGLPSIPDWRDVATQVILIEKAAEKGISIVSFHEEGVKVIA